MKRMVCLMVLLGCAGVLWAGSGEATRDRLVAEKGFSERYGGWSDEELAAAGLAKGDLRILEVFTWLSDGRLTVQNVGKEPVYLAKSDLAVVFQYESLRQLNSLKPPRGAEQSFGFLIEPGQVRTFRAAFAPDRQRNGFATGFRFVGVGEVARGSSMGR